MTEAVRLAASAIEQFRRFSLYNSPYPAHDRGCGIDLYPEMNLGISPVAGEVVDTRTVRCPDQPYAADYDHLIVIDTGAYLARVLHVEPAVTAGDRVAVGDPLGETVRSGFFGRWVDDHVHLEFRPPDANPYRATGSLPLVPEIDVEPVAWDGTGRVVETGQTYAVLDSPTHPEPGRYVSLASDEGVPLDGGLAHYTGGGRFDGTPGADEPLGDTAGTPDPDDLATATDDSVTETDNLAAATDDSTTNAGGSAADGGNDVQLSLLDTPVGWALGRTVEWNDLAVFADGRRITGLSLFASREAGFGVKLVSRPAADQPSFELGEKVEVTIEPTDDPVRLG